MQISVIYEDAYCLVVNKPNNLLVHHSYYARNIEELSLVQLLQAMGYAGAVPVHRLDRKTSGLLLFAKDKANVAVFQELFGNDLVQKTYLALVRGHLNDSGSIDSPVKNERGNYKEALTNYTTLVHLERAFVIPPYPSQRYSIVAFTPVTGRMHQLRIHANKIAHPIINDPKYGNRHHNHYFQEELGLHELFLHAWKLEFTHPFSGNMLALEVAPPSHWETFLPENL